MASTAVLPVEEVELSAVEYRRRQVESALGTTLAEGVSPGSEALTLSEEYVRGEMTLQEFGAAVRRLSRILPAA